MLRGHNRGPFSRHAGGGSTTDSDATAWKAAVVAAGGTVSDTQLGYVSTLITSLKAGSVWTPLDRLWLFASANAFQALIDIKALAAATLVNGPLFTANTGYLCNGSAYIDLAYNPSTGVHFAQNSAHYAFYSRAVTEGLPVLQTKTISTTGLNAYPNVGGDLYFRLNDNPETGAIGVSTDFIGFTAANRSGASAREAYRNGAALGSYGASPSQAPLNDTLKLGDAISQFAAFSIGGSLTSGQHAAYYTAVQAYMTSVGAQV